MHFSYNTVPNKGSSSAGQIPPLGIEGKGRGGFVDLFSLPLLGLLLPPNPKRRKSLLLLPRVNGLLSSDDPELVLPLPAAVLRRLPLLGPAARLAVPHGRQWKALPLKISEMLLPVYLVSLETVLPGLCRLGHVGGGVAGQSVVHPVVVATMPFSLGLCLMDQD